LLPGWLVCRIGQLCQLKSQRRSQSRSTSIQLAIYQTSITPPYAAINVNSHLRVLECQHWHPLSRCNEPRSTRTTTPQPPALFVPRHAGDSYRPLEKISHHTELSASICTAVAAAIDKQDKAKEVDEEEIWCAAAAATIDAEEHGNENEFSDKGVEDLNKAFDNLIGAKSTGQDDLNYFDIDDDDDYLQEIKDEAHLIEYSDAKKVCHGRRQTNIIPGGPKPPDYSGMSSAELAEAKKEYKRERKGYTDGLRMKHLHAQNKSFDPDAFTGCLFPTL
jgi:hypothetical protein